MRTPPRLLQARLPHGLRTPLPHLCRLLRNIRLLPQPGPGVHLCRLMRLDLCRIRHGLGGIRQMLVCRRNRLHGCGGLCRIRHGSGGLSIGSVGYGGSRHTCDKPDDVAELRSLLILYGSQCYLFFNYELLVFILLFLMLLEWQLLL